MGITEILEKRLRTKEQTWIVLIQFLKVKRTSQALKINIALPHRNIFPPSGKEKSFTLENIFKESSGIRSSHRNRKLYRLQ
jgi:hypothetical protein